LAQFPGAVVHDGAIFTSADLRSAQFPGAILHEANLYEANLTAINPNLGDRTLPEARGANFTGASLIHADLGGADASWAVFDSAIMDRVVALGRRNPTNFAFANLANARLLDAVLGVSSGMAELPANLSHVYMPNAQLTNAFCQHADFSNARFYGQKATAQGANMVGARFDHAIISGLDLSRATLDECSFAGAEAVSCKFTGASLKTASFHSAYLLGADFRSANLAGANFTDAAVSTAECDSSGSCSRCGQTDASCTFSQLDQSHLCCYTYVERDGKILFLDFDKTYLPKMTGYICPSGVASPCTEPDALRPSGYQPYPTIPECIPSPTGWPCP